VVEQGGSVKLLEPGETTAPADDFLKVAPKNENATQIGPEMGLLGFALHPDFPDDPRVYINWNPAEGSTTVIDEFTLSANDPDVVDPASQRTVLQLHQPAGNHNGGMIAFGPDGYLYIGMGDGGGGGNPYDTAQDPAYALGSILRIDVEPTGSTDEDPPACMGCPTYGPFDYGIPADNPFVDGAGLDEIWAIGVRNPWRFSFDGDVLYAGDVGQNAYEEIDIISKGGDYGWSDMEGFHCYDQNGCDGDDGPNGVNQDGYTLPIHEYAHNDSPGGCSVTGGYVYHSCEATAWDGMYFFSDYCAGDIRALLWDGQDVTYLGSQASSGESVFGFGTNAWGDVYVATVTTDDFGEVQDGTVYRLAPGG
jgi:glucose/arabinose dehydrogenase